MPPGWRKSIPVEALLQLRQRLERLPPKVLSGPLR